MQHRIFVVPTSPTRAPADARLHWEQRHGDVFAGTPGLRRYRQNRPVGEEWARGRTHVCSETWYDDRDGERAAYASAHYRDVVTPDEESFLDRDAAWSGVVLDADALAPGDGLRVLWFDASPPAGPDWVAVRLDRPVPSPGTGSVVHVAALDDPTQALGLTAAAAPVALVCRAVHHDPADAAAVRR